MSLFDAFSTAPANAAANSQATSLQQALQYYNQVVQGQGVPAFTGYGSDALAGITGNYGAGINAVTGYGNEAINAFSPNIAAGNAGVNAYGDATGANGSGGMARALTNFWSNPGTVASLSQGNAATAAAAAAGGTTASGNEALALQRQNQATTSQGWNNYVSNLQPYLNFSTANTAGQAGAATTTGGQVGTLSGLEGNQIANTNLALGSGLLGAYTGIGNAGYGANASIGNAYANADLSAYQASANQIGAITGLLGLGTSSLGASGMFGSGAGGGAFAGLFPGSDERFKEDIEPIGETADGQTIYRYRYKGHPMTHIGLIAQEVEQAAPDAVHRGGSGMRYVDYHKATDRAASLLKLAAEQEADPIPDAMAYGGDLMRMAA